MPAFGTTRVDGSIAYSYSESQAMGEVTIRELDGAAYTAFLADVPHSVFHRLSFLNAVVSVFSIQLRLLGYEHHGELRAVTPLMGRRIGPFTVWGAPLRKCAVPPATPFCSPAREAKQVLPALRNWTRSQGLGYLQLTLPGTVSPMAAAADRIEPLDNLEFDLRQPLATIWRGLSKQKASVRKAVRTGVKVHWWRGPALLDAQQKMLHDTYGRQRIKPNIPADLYRLLLSQAALVNLRVLCATFGGQIIASIWVLCDADKCYYWDAAALHESRPLNANHLLVWCLIRWAHRNHFGILDFVGTSSGGRAGSRPGIARFKQSMGARPVVYKILYWYSPFMHLAFSGYRLINRLNCALRGSRREQHADSA